MTDEEVRIRISQGEDTRTQFKFAPIGVAKLAAEFVAFANSRGGVIFFGVSDDGRIVGLDDVQKKELDSEIGNAANDTVRPAIYPQTEFHTIDSKLLLAVTIPEGIFKPYADKSGNIWVKTGPDKRRVTAREELQRMLQRGNLLNADETPIVGSSWNDVEPSHVAQFLKKNYGIDPNRSLDNHAMEARRVLTNLGLMRNSELTLSGLLLFGVDPQKFRPVDIIKCVHFPRAEITDLNYLDSQDFSGTIQQLLKGAMAFLERNLCHHQAGQGFNSIGIPIVPAPALEEYVVNMLLHRDYFVRSPWRIFVFSNRIELISPGSLPEGLTVAQMKSGVSVPRNARLFSFAIKDGIPYRGIGSGVSRAIHLYSNVDFVNDPNGFFFKTIVWTQEVSKTERKLRIESASCAMSSNLNMRDSNLDIDSSNLDEQTLKPALIDAVSVLRKDRATSIVRVFDLILANNSVTLAEICAAISASRSAVNGHVDFLKSHGFLLREGGRFGGKWRITMPESISTESSSSAAASPILARS